MKSEKKKFRLDMVITKIEVVGEDRGARVYKFRMVPDPRVWEKKVVNGEQGYWHKIDNMFLSEKQLAQAAPTLRGKSISLESVGLKNKDEYLRRSKKRIEDKSPP